MRGWSVYLRVSAGRVAASVIVHCGSGRGLSELAAPPALYDCPARRWMSGAVVLPLQSTKRSSELNKLCVPIGWKESVQSPF